MSPVMILVGGAVVVLILIGALVFVLASGRRGDRLEDLNQLIESDWKPGPQDAVQVGSGKSSREVMAERLDSALAKRGLAGNIRGQLRKADLKLTVSEYLILHVVASGLGGLLAYMLRPEAPALAGVGVIIGFFVPRVIVSLKQRQRLNAFQNQLADILNLWVNSLRAGFSVPQAMEAVAREAPAPANVEFKRVVAEISIGIPFETALNNMLSRIESEDLDLVFTAVNIQREVGGNLAEILDTISHTIRERVRIKGEIRTLTASGRATGTLISMLPIGLAIFMLFLRPEYMGQLFYGPPVGAYIPGMRIPCGWPIVALGLIMIAIAWGVIKRITDIEV
jgi:tight adherence protein B